VSLTPAQVRLSKRVARVLRHAPQSVGLTLDAQGWVPVSELLAAVHATRVELEVVVAGDGKVRPGSRHQNGVWLTDTVPSEFLRPLD
jgi:putative RNA 2'-phosphotransferase